ncbi:hypothetical protein GF339_14970 [candidate division KSB3 bacterium]|jgi:ABC-type branched-subunit amino acid transport system permease subunit|uniref:Branched-chain amino acid ABC transporter permease n=1 Tax=candidate division KSB3 bacterium TaxID=2044937 RepID=A0A9D5JY74_9BACT|nr:hypothetical protein [candidate division KSB3 bacterium]MBD3325886.1 hypothetical protein [candidate division KSB3 bacterium]
MKETKPTMIGVSPATLTGKPRNPYVKLIVIIILLLAPYVLTQLGLSFEIYFIAFLCIFSIVALGLDIIVGLSGMVSIGHASLFGVGAYSVGIVCATHGFPFWVGMIVGILLTTVIATLMGIPALKVEGPYLALLTIGFGWVIYLFLVNASGITRGWNGIYGIERPALFGISLSEDWAFTTFTVAVLIACYFLYKNISYSRFGRALRAMREEELAALSLGIDTRLYKIMAFGLSGIFAGLAGSLFAFQLTYLSPVSFDFGLSVDFLSFLIIGGIGTVFGPIVGTFALYTLVEYFFSAYSQYRFFLYGFSIILVLFFVPGGIVGASKDLLHSIQRRSRRSSSNP